MKEWSREKNGQRKTKKALYEKQKEYKEEMMAWKSMKEILERSDQ